MTTRTEQLDLASDVSQWSQRLMYHSISSSIIAQQLLTPEIKKVWQYVVKNVGSITPLQTLLMTAKKISAPPAPELISHHNRISQEDADLDLEMANLAKNVESHSAIVENNMKEISALNSVVYMQPSKLEVIHAYHLLLLKDVSIIKDLISKAHSAVTELPCNKLSIYKSSQLARDVQEVVEMLDTYYKGAGNSTRAEEIHKVHFKLRQMIKLYKSEDFLELLSCKVDTQKLQISEDRSDIPMLKRAMDKCFAQLQAAHKISFISVQTIKNRIVDLESQKAHLICQVKQFMSTTYPQAERMCHAGLMKTLKTEMTKQLLEPEVPYGMPSLSIKDLEEVQHQIEISEEACSSISLQTAKVSYANKSMLESVCTAHKIAPSGDSNDVTSRYTLLKTSLKSSPVADVDEFQELLLLAMLHEPDVMELCTRTGSTIMSSLVKDNLQKALGMQDYECPSTLAMHLQRKIDNFWCNISVKRILTTLLNNMDLRDIICKFDKILEGVVFSNSHGGNVIVKATHLSNYVISLLSGKELEECLQDYKELPAFNDDIL